MLTLTKHPSVCVSWQAATESGPYCINCCPTPFPMCQDEPPILWRNFVGFPASIGISPVFEYCHKPLILNCHPVFSLELRHSVPDFVSQIFSIGLAVGSLAKPDLVWTPDPSGRARKGLGNNLAQKCLECWNAAVGVDEGKNAFQPTSIRVQLMTGCEYTVECRNF